MKQSVAERVLADESWTDLADVVDYHIPLPAISTDLGTFSREFAVDLDAINPDKENPQVIAFTAGPLELIPDYQIKAKHLDIQIEFYS